MTPNGEGTPMALVDLIKARYMALEHAQKAGAA